MARTAATAMTIAGAEVMVTKRSEIMTEKTYGRLTPSPFLGEGRARTIKGAGPLMDPKPRG